jgi:hypothetical protein
MLPQPPRVAISPLETGNRSTAPRVEPTCGAYPRFRPRPRGQVGRRTRRSRVMTCRRGRVGRRGRVRSAGPRLRGAAAARSRRLPTYGNPLPRIRLAHRATGRRVADDDPVAAGPAKLHPFRYAVAVLDPDGGGSCVGSGVLLQPANRATIQVAAVEPHEAARPNAEATPGRASRPHAALRLDVRAEHPHPFGSVGGRPPAAPSQLTLIASEPIPP